ncbi:hypothetical protein AV530_014795 [Patagioenas fasciata monilis]|uniref:Uncharacterized protein n=1 Tax=Patagioenas fasciata monilis TaxID=372326 RepID=A0A1V4L0K6_PATFA|nr:hypothetical protein AV530_014795 [Patagioenas fasciata monilis]
MLDLITEFRLVLPSISWLSALSEFLNLRLHLDSSPGLDTLYLRKRGENVLLVSSQPSCGAGLKSFFSALQVTHALHVHESCPSSL